MRKYIHITSKIPAKISINGETFTKNKLDIMSQDDFYITFLPNNKEYLPYAMSIKDSTLPSFIQKIPYNKNHFDIIFNPSPTACTTTGFQILNKKYNNCIFSINVSHHSFINISSSTYKYSSFADKIASASFKSIKEIIIIDGFIDENHRYLLIFNTRSKKVVLEGIFQQIEQSISTIKALKQPTSLLKYGIIYEFDIKNNKLSQYSVHIDTKNIECSSEIIPLLFLECIKYKDFNRAKTFLFDNNVSKLHLENFFGEINEIYFNGYTTDINYTILSNNIYKNFTFNVIDNKILDIEENQIK